ncbi:hypothetical protein [Micromonospora sp. 067-2]|uniref:hypothetical protein n=1 Tax=Micromonospora sp. 067-2 TaxID=2789270 RepID=UPI003978EDCC
MSRTLLLHETRRAGWPALTAVPVVLAAGTGIALILVARGNDTDVFVQFWLREMLPLAFGLAVAAVPAAETCLEVQLSLPTPLPLTLARRAGLSLSSSALAAVALAVAAQLGGLWHPVHGAVAGELTWVSPAIALGGLGAAVFALTGSVSGAGATVAGVWLLQDLTVQWYDRRWSRPLYLFVDDGTGPLAGWWWLNRLTLIAVGALLVGAAALMLTVRRERVFAARLLNLGGDQ